MTGRRFRRVPSRNPASRCRIPRLTAASLGSERGDPPTRSCSRPLVRQTRLPRRRRLPRRCTGLIRPLLLDPAKKYNRPRSSRPTPTACSGRKTRIRTSSGASHPSHRILPPAAPPPAMIVARRTTMARQAIMVRQARSRRSLRCNEPDASTEAAHQKQSAPLGALRIPSAADHQAAFAAPDSAGLVLIAFGEAELIAIWRGLNCSGISRTNSTCRRPLASDADLTST